MDKDTYETYEYMPTGSAESEAGQFFIVQDDGTFLINRQVQYVTQVEEEKEALDGVQNCTVYDVTQQQFFVDVDNSSELISVPDNFILPESSGNIYGSSYLLQTVPSTSNSQIEEDAVDNQFNQTETQVDDVTDVNKKNSSCTEITLSDEQYKMLEEKGWILLETNEKVFILDTLGLHDITTNLELIEQLKSESKCSNNLEIGSRPLKTEEQSAITFDSVITQNSSQQQESVDFAIENINTQNDDTLVDTPVIEEQDKIDTVVPIKEEQNDVLYKTESEQGTIKESNRDEELNRSKLGKSVRIKTKFTFKDIPNKIVLGKTVNGKNLVAKLKKSNNVIISGNNSSKQESIPLDVQRSTIASRSCKSILKKENPHSKYLKHSHQSSSSHRERRLAGGFALNHSLLVLITENVGLFTWQFDKLIREVVQNGKCACSAKQVVAAGEVIEQLLQILDFQSTVVETNIIVTKVLKNKLEENSNDNQPSIVTGRVTSLNGRLRFVHIPDLLQKLVRGTKLQKLNSEGMAIAGDCSVLHVHITETKGVDSANAFTITLNKRFLPYFLSSEIKKSKSKVFACSSCATIFNSAEELTVHQVTHCEDFNDTLTIDTDKIDNDNFDEDLKLNPYYIVKSNTGTLYACLYCSMKFNKLSNCLRHLKSHMKHVTETSNKELTAEKSSENNASDLEDKIYKCKMCSSSYYHSSTLSKHIVKTHIKVNKSKQ